MVPDKRIFEDQPDTVPRLPCGRLAFGAISALPPSHIVAARATDQHTVGVCRIRTRPKRTSFMVTVENG